MCGLAGLLNPHGIADGNAVRALIGTMCDQIAHRGPDDSGMWLDQEPGLALGFRRLSILDLSPAGHQPMASSDGRYVVVMNGEIYNFAAIRAEIEAVRGAHPWRGHSDTEALVEAMALWGIEPALRRANGMFALAVWDREERALSLARGRSGKKPLYYGWAGDTFVFGSELKALWPHPDFDFRIDTKALGDFLRLGYVPGTRTIFSAISSLRNGCVLRFDLGAAAVLRKTAAPSAYWSLKEVALGGLDAQAAGRTASVEEFEAVLRDAVALRMVADVPVGAFLSGGIDSSLVTALMAAASPCEVRSFSIGFEGATWDEAPHAAAVAAHLGTQHEEMYVSPRDVLAVVGDLPSIYDEPFADDSMIPTTLLCRMARRSVTVALSGDGGDELFAGYDKYASAGRWLGYRGAMPRLARSLAGAVMEGAVAPLARCWGGKAARRARLLGTLLTGGDGEDGAAERFNAAIMEQTLDSERLLAAPRRRRRDAGMEEAGGGLGRSTAIDRLTFMDTSSYLIDDILVKVDRASMAASLEVRCPLLDYRLIELSWRFPTREKTRAGVGKLPLRTVLYRHVPQALVERPKMGFGAPVQIWLRDGLRDWAEALMSRPALAESGLLDVNACRHVWEAFAVHGRGWDSVIWRLLMFQAWHEWMTRQRVASRPVRTAATAHFAA